MCYLPFIQLGQLSTRFAGISKNSENSFRLLFRLWLNALADFSPEQEELVARWEDPEYRFDLLRVSYGPAYTLVGTRRNLEVPAQTANAEAIRLDNLEAPQRDAERVAKEQGAKAATLEKARIVNKAKFRP